MLIETMCVHGDSLAEMAKLDPKSIDMVFCDLPYGVTGHLWDAVIPFDKLWAAYGRVVKDRGAIVLTATEPFANAAPIAASPTTGS